MQTARRLRKERLEKLRDLRGKDTEKPKHYRVTVQRRGGESMDDVMTLESHAMRLRRCQRRVRAWASALPRDNRLTRRAGKAYKIGPRLVMLTLTYADAAAWSAGHIREFMISLRGHLGAALYGYGWVLEMQARGAPHYHVLIYVRRGANVPLPEELWPHGLTRIETARTPFYISSYTSKAYQKNGLPKGARMFAVQIYKHVLSEDEMLPFRLSSAPGWLRDILEEIAQEVGPGIRWSRCPGGGWVCRDTGEIYPSPWELISIEEM
jgi:hypothetical protein